MDEKLRQVNKNSAEVEEQIYQLLPSVAGKGLTVINALWPADVKVDYDLQAATDFIFGVEEKFRGDMAQASKPPGGKGKGKAPAAPAPAGPINALTVYVAADYPQWHKDVLAFLKRTLTDDAVSHVASVHMRCN